MCVLYLSCSCAGPSAAPTNFVAVPLNATAVQLEWQSPPASLLNGDLLQFTATYSSSQSAGTISFPSNVRRGIVNDLSPWTAYNLTLAATTIAGNGPAATAQINTHESGKNSLSLTRVFSDLLLVCSPFYTNSVSTTDQCHVGSG